MVLLVHHTFLQYSNSSLGQTRCWAKLELILLCVHLKIFEKQALEGALSRTTWVGG